MAGDAYTGLRRRKQTPWSVRFGDAIASRMIAIGGIGTIAAILLVVLVLLATALPLLKSPSYATWHTVDAAAYRHVGVDENGLLFWGMLNDGQVEVRTLQSGDLVASFPLDLEADQRITSSCLSIDRRSLAIGLSDGTFRLADIGFETRLLLPSQLPTGVRVSPEEPLQTAAEAVFQWIDASGVRQTSLSPISWSAPKRLGESAVVALDYLPDDSTNRLSQSTSAHALAVVGGELVFAEISGKKNMLTRKITETIRQQACPLQVRNESQQPLEIVLLNGTDHAVVVWENGTLDRFSLANGTPQFAESQTAVVGQGRVTCAGPLLARQNLLCGLDDGRLQGWMITRDEGQDVAADAAGDGFRLTLAHEIAVSSKALTSVTSSEQTHVAVTADTAGQTSLVYVTTDTLLGTEQAPVEGEIRSIALDPGGDTLVVATENALATVGFDIGYPEASPRSFFGKVWYEGHTRPKYIWQSSAGTEKSEIKISLIPLIFGTLKATVYAMAISMPLAILAAIYTSEFLSPRARTRVKPVIELMASLPSVVLGYIAALVIASYLQEHLLAILLGVVIVPLTFVAAGNLWNLLPVDLMVRLQPARLLVMVVCLPVAMLLSDLAARPIEAWWFDGSLIQWLGRADGSPVGGWMLLLMPALILLMSLVFFGPLAERTRRLAAGKTPRAYALFAIARFFVVALFVLVLCWGLASLLSGFGWDLRGSFFGTYQDRNALLVGGALGFCVIPIIYTISDDALQAVPQQLRSASLGCGATPWQTTIRVVVPSAMSGLFSAVMIGLGRAVGETMVVLMAAGNTPVMEWNPFNGFRTLSATLATELPEAAKGSTHFRTLFLAALLLFFLTLVANTFAEYVRLRFRKRASQL